MGEHLRSVGIDVGTSTTQLVLSRLTVENRAGAFAVPDLEIAGREILYRSPIHFTPLKSSTVLDAQGIRDIVAREYALADIARDSVSTGAIIITGETARKENARAVLESLSDFAGDFVVATAGPDLESVLAARGAGADAYSEKTGKTVLHMDIGGGTSNLALIEAGGITQTGCLNVGGRLVKISPEGTVQYVSPVLEGLCSLQPGQRAGQADLAPVVELLVQALEIAAGLRPGRIPAQLLTNRVPVLPAGPLTLSFSGGVADLIQKSPDDTLAYGDIGVLLGRAIRDSRLCQGDYVLGRETIRATVIGAGCHSTQLSGSTVFCRAVELPLQDLPVVALTEPEQDLSGDHLAQRLQEAMGRYGEAEGGGNLALAMPGLPNPGYDAVSALADRLARGLEPVTAAGKPAVVVTGTDMAKALGQALATRLPPGAGILCLDSLGLEDGSFLDVGAPLSGGAAFPVVRKTLILS